MKCNKNYLLFSQVLVVALAFSQGTTVSAQDYSRMSTEQRLERLEKINSSRDDLQLSQSLDALQQDIQSLRGQLEVLEHQMSGLSKQQKDYYNDLNVRIRKLQGAGVATTPSSTTGMSPAESAAVSSATTTTAAATTTVPLEDSLGPTAADLNSTQGTQTNSHLNQSAIMNTGSDTTLNPTMPAAASTPIATTLQAPVAGDNAEAYLAAYQLVVNRNFSEAQSALQQYIDQYPNGEYVANAYYWLGEVHLTQKQLPEAERAFKTVVERYPNHSKTPDALLKLGYTYVAEGNTPLARQTFVQVKERYSHLAVAQLADAQLSQLGP